MSPRLEHEPRVDDMSDYAQQQSHPNLIDQLSRLPAAELVAEGNALSARMLGSLHTTRDFAIVAALTQRVQMASVEHARQKVRLSAPDTITLGKEPLEGMLVLDLSAAA